MVVEDSQKDINYVMQSVAIFLNLGNGTEEDTQLQRHYKEW
jgi:hypothetical protein